VGNWEHAHLFMDDSGTVVAESDLSSQEVVLTGGGGGSQTVLSAVVDLTSAQIATLFTVPIEVLSAQGVGTVIVPVSASFQYFAGAVAFVDTAHVAVGSVPGTLTFTFNFNADVAFNGLDSVIAFGQPSSLSPIQTSVENVPLYIFGVDQDPGDAGASDGTARVQFLYYVMNLL
jgi:hypothetical protein